jgi:hypothetical protein
MWCGSPTVKRLKNGYSRHVVGVVLLCLSGCHDQSPHSLAQQPGEQPAEAEATPPELLLEYAAFDQEPGQGWRRLADAGQYREAATLIGAYLKHRDGLANWQRRNLQFHAGQTHAFAGDDTAALLAFRAALDPNESPTSPIRWNAYVQATIAFLEKNREELKRKRDEISRGSEFQGSVPNLEAVDRLIAHFGKPYFEAYQCNR